MLLDDDECVYVHHPRANCWDSLVIIALLAVLSFEKAQDQETLLHSDSPKRAGKPTIQINTGWWFCQHFFQPI